MQVIVIGIDGLRQDVLYDAYDHNKTNPHAASYSDTGCDGKTCRVEIKDLPGLSQILKGYSEIDPQYKQYIMLKDVTAIFPSITLASWASIFTGKMPNETGITGNEFFARDSNLMVPSLFNKANPGMITFDGGALPGYSEYHSIDWKLWWGDTKVFGRNYIVPYRANWEDTADPMDLPQNKLLRTGSKTIFEALTSEGSNIKNYYDKNGGDAVVVAYSHYARGASRWLTHGALDSIPWTDLLSEKWRLESLALDKASWVRFKEYLDGRYLDGSARNKVPFSALTVWYIPGLDHYAHGVGMGGYKDYFKDTTDKEYIQKFVDWLKKKGEFDNKVFIIVADHGHTAMPDSSQMTIDERDEDGNLINTWNGYNSCELKLDKFNSKKVYYPELANNNLHIWELGEMFKSVGLNIEDSTWWFKVLVPVEISALNKVKDKKTKELIDAPYGAINSNPDIIVGLNGPMAHVDCTPLVRQIGLGQSARVFGF